MFNTYNETAISSPCIIKSIKKHKEKLFYEKIKYTFAVA